MVHASCLCGDVSWDIDGPFLFMSHCHCSRCRKFHGTPFATYVGGPAASLTLRGSDAIAGWESSPGFVRSFCRTCGSKVPGAPWQDLHFVPAGNFDDDPGHRPEANIFVDSKASWFEITDGLTCFAAYPDGVDAPVLADSEPPDRGGNGVRGSCGCRAVTFRMIEPPLDARNCHCGRCRKGRSAAYAANLFVTLGGLVYTHGQDRIVEYKVPAADRFTQAFCSICGSAMPVTYRDRGVSVVPMGAFDDDPGIRPRSHIFVGSKAPWFEITDDLPQFAGYPD